MPSKRLREETTREKAIKLYHTYEDRDLALAKVSEYAILREVQLEAIQKDNDDVRKDVEKRMKELGFSIH